MGVASGAKSADVAVSRARPSIASLFAPPAHRDPHDVVGDPIDIRSASFGQDRLRMILDLRTQGPWTPAQFGHGRSLCIAISGRSALGVCVAQKRHRAALQIQDVTASGQTGTTRTLPATVSRPDPRTVHASFPVWELGFPIGRFAWSARSTFSDGEACSTPCVDSVPDRGTFSSSIRVLAEPDCFGAAARDTRRRCRNPLLDRLAYPRPYSAFIWPNAPCHSTARSPTAVFNPCQFGVPARGARATIALIGDSHAAHWRGALEVVAEAKAWRGFSISRAGCPFSTQIPGSPSLGPGACREMQQQTLTWLRATPEIRTVFMSDWAEPGSGPQGGQAGYGGGAAQFEAMIDKMPASIKHIFVLRDIPATSLSAVDCVQRLIARYAVIRNRCWTSRAAAVTYDPGAAAAGARRSRAQVVDLTRHFCDRARCYAVVGGSFVYKDDNHMNNVFSTSLGPFLLRALRAVT
jgi:hypothetical protein